MSITDWPAAERPREKLLAQGPGMLSDAELLRYAANTERLLRHEPLDLTIREGRTREALHDRSRPDERTSDDRAALESLARRGVLRGF